MGLDTDEDAIDPAGPVGRLSPHHVIAPDTQLDPQNAHMEAKSLAYSISSGCLLTLATVANKDTLEA